MAQAKSGDTVTIHYTGRLEDGTVFDTSEGGEPLRFELGGGRVIPGFESAVEGMEAGASTTAEVPAAEAYGERRDELVMQLPADRLPADLDPGVGDQLEMQTPDGQKVPVRVVDVSEEAVTLDANHPLAGRDLVFDIELVTID